MLADSDLHRQREDIKQEIILRVMMWTPDTEAAQMAFDRWAEAFTKDDESALALYDELLPYLKRH